MTNHEPEPETVPQNALDLALDELACSTAALGAKTLTMLALEAESVEVVYGRDEGGRFSPPTAPILCGRDIRAALESDSGPVRAGTEVARFLTDVAAPAGASQIRSFQVFSLQISQWRERLGITSVFGFEEHHPPQVFPAHVCQSIDLAALAVWSMREVTRLRAELRAVNRGIAGRKAVDRAKAILQSQRGMTEQQAYEYIRRMSRQRRVTLAKLAEDLIAAGRWP